MKKLTIALLMALMASTVMSQNLIDIYKKGTVKLVPDTEYGVGNNWDKVFKSYNDKYGEKPIGQRKKITVLPDGSVVVDHYYRDYFTRFSPNGKFVKEFSITKNDGSTIKDTRGINGIVNDNIFFGGVDKIGRMFCFDFNGNYQKTLKLDYMIKQAISLPNGKIVVVGWVLWKEKIRDFVSIIDYETNEEKIIWDHFTDRSNCPPAENCKLFHYGYAFKSRGMVSLSTMPYADALGMQSPPKIESIGDNLVIAYPGTGEIVICNLDGKAISKTQMNGVTNFISVEEQKEIQKKAIEKYKSLNKPIFAGWASEEENKEALQSMVKQMEDDLTKIKDPIKLPYFSNIIKDSDGNLLIFEFPKEENANKFNVWVIKNGGEVVCQSTFVCDDYDLEINPSKFVFHNGYVYGLQKLKNAEGVPLRLQRFKLE